MVAIQCAAKLVASLPEDDRDIAWLRHLEISSGRLELCEASLDLLSRFGMDRGAWQQGVPTDAQIRNLLRRMDGAEAAARGAERRDAS